MSDSILKIKQCKESNDPWDSEEKSEGQAKTLKRSNNASVIEQDWYFSTEVLIYTI